MQIKAGQFYRTRCGKKAFVAAVENPFCDAQYPIIGYIACDNGSAKWTSAGEFCNSFVNSPYDLIAEWKEPVTATHWCCLWDDGGVSIHSIKPQPQPLLKAIKQVSITEGEGM